jgi:hypothetical protein
MRRPLRGDGRFNGEERDLGGWWAGMTRSRSSRTWTPRLELEAAGLIVLADKVYQGAAHANAQLKTWRVLRKLRCCPWRAGQLAKAIHVLQSREA